ncbi:Panacea domain-containing protein [Cellulosimicrobium cellulans]|uniref:Panacea domain-containing protein n=1 Tax=Cellulosimicrobium cellulans TaxID=1710 RepID=UPI00130D657D|nr:type II toxin-antitoxin system antitoxin SocA domain-containing protein [Cellulosimicrobium cellulans]
MAQIHDVAAYMIDHFDSGISTMKLQKLCYMAQGWSLALVDEPLFDDDFEAWKRGPVARTLFNVHRGSFSKKEWPQGDASQLSQREAIICDAVVANYGSLSGLELSELTHLPGTPWSTTRAAELLQDHEPSQAPISKDLMRTYFKKTLLQPSQ